MQIQILVNVAGISQITKMSTMTRNTRRRNEMFRSLELKPVYGALRWVAISLILTGLLCWLV